MILINVLIAAVATFILYLLVEFVISIKQFLIFKRVREAVLLTTFMYLKKTPQRFVDLQILKGFLLNRLKDTKLESWVNDIRITWHSNDAIQFVFELNFEKLKPKYKFVIGLDEFDKGKLTE